MTRTDSSGRWLSVILLGFIYLVVAGPANANWREVQCEAAFGVNAVCCEWCSLVGCDTCPWPDASARSWIHEDR